MLERTENERFVRIDSCIAGAPPLRRRNTVNFLSRTVKQPLEGRVWHQSCRSSPQQRRRRALDHQRRAGARVRELDAQRVQQVGPRLRRAAPRRAGPRAPPRAAAPRSATVRDAAALRAWCAPRRGAPRPPRAVRHSAWLARHRVIKCASTALPPAAVSICSRCTCPRFFGMRSILLQLPWGRRDGYPLLTNTQMLKAKSLVLWDLSVTRCLARMAGR
jgi:hypothetical protein